MPLNETDVARDTLGPPMLGMENGVPFGASLGLLAAESNMLEDLACEFADDLQDRGKTAGLPVPGSALVGRTLFSAAIAVFPANPDRSESGLSSFYLAISVRIQTFSLGC